MLNSAIVDRLLLARLSLDPLNAPDDPEVLTVLAGLPSGQTVLEYLIGCWKRCGAERLKVVGRKV